MAVSLDPADYHYRVKKSEERSDSLALLCRDIDERASLHAEVFPDAVPTPQPELWLGRSFEALLERPIEQEWQWIFYPLIHYLLDNADAIWVAIGHIDHAWDKKIWAYFLKASGPSVTERRYAGLSFWRSHIALPRQQRIVTGVTDLAEEVEKSLRAREATGSGCPPDFGLPLIGLLQGKNLHGEVHGRIAYHTCDLRSYRKLVARKDRFRILLPKKTPPLPAEPQKIHCHEWSAETMAAYTAELKMERSRLDRAGDSARLLEGCIQGRIQQNVRLREQMQAYSIWSADFTPTAGSVLSVHSHIPSARFFGRTGALVACFDRSTPLQLPDQALLASAFRIGCLPMSRHMASHAAIEDALSAFGHETSKILGGLQYWIRPGDDDRGTAERWSLLEPALQSIVIWARGAKANPFGESPPTSFEMLVKRCWRAAVGMEAAWGLERESKQAISDKRRGEILAAYAAETEPTVAGLSLSLSWEDDAVAHASIEISRVLICLLANSVRYGKDGTVTVKLEGVASSPQKSSDVTELQCTIENRPNGVISRPREGGIRFGSYDVASTALAGIGGRFIFQSESDADPFVVRFTFVYPTS